MQSRLSKFKNQLMEVKTNKEYQAMQKEMSVAEQEISDFETRMLERMEEADGLAVELKTAQAALASGTGRDRPRATGARERTRDRRRRPEERERGARPDRGAGQCRGAGAVRARGAGPRGLAMAEARDGLCTVCHVRLRPQVFNEVRRNAGIVQCDSCTRILYFVPAPSGGRAAAAS